MGYDGAAAAAFLRQQGCRVALVEQRAAADFVAIDPPPRLATTVRGFNLNGGKRLSISVYVRE
jgi:2-polyprenyl-6-methoxyphenol hydroxylase-like FAD-dependent oxidoreductase